MLQSYYLLKHKPNHVRRPYLDLTAATLELIQERAMNPDAPYAVLVRQATALGHTLMDVCDIHDRAKLLRMSGLSIAMPEGQALVANPTEEQWEAEMIEDHRAYDQMKKTILEQASAASAGFRNLDVNQMGEHYARRPDPEVWDAIMSLVPRSVRDHAEYIGDTLMDREEEVRARQEWEREDY
jgi:hypothetical protein